MRIDRRITSRSILGPWVLNDLPASQTNATMGFGANGAAVLAARVTRAGSVVGIGVNMSAAAAGSAITFDVQKNGSDLISGALSISAGSASGSATFGYGSYTFAAGDIVRVVFNTDGSWTGTTVDASAILEIET